MDFLIKVPDSWGSRLQFSTRITVKFQNSGFSEYDKLCDRVLRINFGSTYHYTSKSTFITFVTFIIIHHIHHGKKIKVFDLLRGRSRQLLLRQQGVVQNNFDCDNCGNCGNCGNCQVSSVKCHPNWYNVNVACCMMIWVNFCNILTF